MRFVLVLKPVKVLIYNLFITLPDRYFINTMPLTYKPILSANKAGLICFVALLKSFYPFIAILASLLVFHHAQAKPLQQNSNDRPQRIVSLSLCTDQLLLMLVEKKRIQSLSHLSIDPTYSYMSEQAQGLRIHYNLAEEIVPLKPDLIIGSQFSRGNTSAMLKTLGFNLQQVSSPTTIKEIEQHIIKIGGLVGEPQRAQQLIQALRDDLDQAKQLLRNTPRKVAISYGPNGFTAGTKTLKQAILDLAGYDNLASLLGIDYYGNITVEKLIVANPDVIIIDESIPDQNSLAQNYVNHPALEKLYAGKKRPSVASNLWLCPGPTAGKAILSLVEQRLGLSHLLANSSSLLQVPQPLEKK